MAFRTRITWSLSKARPRVTNRRKADGNVVSVPSPKSGASIETHNGTLKDSFHLSYDSDHGRVRIYPWMNRGLLERS